LDKTPAEKQEGKQHQENTPNNKNPLEVIQARLNIPQIAKILFEQGEEMDMNLLSKTFHLPNLRTFKYVKYFRSDSKRWS
jgi:hypothetical protein